VSVSSQINETYERIRKHQAGKDNVEGKDEEETMEIGLEIREGHVIA
jgi:hypothetical protein